MPRARIAKTLVEDVIGEMRRDILSGRLAPGTRLKMSALSSRLEVSLSVVREALNRLVEQGLVSLEPQVGFRVVELSPDALVDLTVARVHVEVSALRASVRQGDLAWEASLVAAHHALAGTAMFDEPAETPVPRLSEAWARAHAAFHQALIAGCGSRRLLDIACGLRESAELYRQWAGPIGAAHVRDVAAEHRALCQAALERDEELAARLLTEHIERTTRLLLEHSGELSAPAT